MVISFSSGLQVTVPNDQFMVPFVTIDRNGSRIFNNSQKEFLFNGVADQQRTLGRYFLTAAYLMVNYDANTFTLWQANPSITSQLVPVIGKSTNSEACTSTAGTAQPSATDTVGLPSGSPPSQSGSLSGGIVAAIAVVSVVAVGLLTLWAYFVIGARKRRGQVRLVEGTTPAQQSVLEQSKHGFRQTRIHEMHSESRPYEVPGSEAMVYELEGRVVR